MTYDAAATHRVQRATFSILIIGAIAGAILGAGLPGVVGLLADGPGGYPYLWDAFILAAFVGGILGGLSLPFVASTVLSHVAIGRILTYAAIGTVVGTLAISLVSPFDSVLSTLGAVAGFVAAMMLLKRDSKTTTSCVLIIVAIVSTFPLESGAQAARVGRLPLLATPAAGARCTTMPITPELRSAGIARLLNIEEPTHPRLLTLGVTSHDKPLMLMAMMSTRQERRGEGESISIFFDNDTRILSGHRSAYTTGIPARRSDDRNVGLLPTDSTDARSLVRALLKLCRR